VQLAATLPHTPPRYGWSIFPSGHSTPLNEGWELGVEGENATPIPVGYAEGAANLKRPRTIYISFRRASPVERLQDAGVDMTTDETLELTVKKVKRVHG
jgi:hypothetical protein